MNYQVFGEFYYCTLNIYCFFIQILHSLVNKTVVGNHEFCIVVNPCDDSGKPRLGQRVLRKGVTSFFLQPGIFTTAYFQEIFL